MARLTSRILIDILIRRTQAAGGFATILCVGDPDRGAILVQCSDRGQLGSLLERPPGYGSDGAEWHAVGPAPTEGGEVYAAYQQRRRRNDPDLWILELDIAEAPQLVAEWSALT